MSNWIISKSAVTDFLDELGKSYQVFAPLKREDILVLERVGDHDQVVLDFYNTKQAPKEVFFPRSEVLFSYRDGKVIPTSLPDERRVVFGIRPCDARSAVLLDNVFDAPDYQDPYYVNRRQNTLLIGLACNKPLTTCFCTTVGGGPFSVDGLDLLWTDLGDRYLVETITERGEALTANSSCLRQATEEDTAAKAKIAAAAEQMISGPSTEGVKETLDGMYEDPFWDESHLKCLGCGVCTYLCPTCHCFDITDETDGSQGRRIRTWDSCMYPLFTLHASGHNPRPTRKERMRQRIMHKFSYSVQQYRRIFCVGCGRCVAQCPVNLDIRMVIKEITEAR